jgi:hypothetical protein
VNSKNKDDAIQFVDNKKDLPLVAQRITEWAKADFEKGLAPASWPRLQFEQKLVHKKYKCNFNSNFSDKTITSLWSNANSNSKFLAILIDKEPATQSYSVK